MQPPRSYSFNNLQADSTSGGSGNGLTRSSSPAHVSMLQGGKAMTTGVVRTSGMKTKKSHARAASWSGQPARVREGKEEE
jgi:hypothetical protein